MRRFRWSKFALFSLLLSLFFLPLPISVRAFDGNSSSSDLSAAESSDSALSSVNDAHEESLSDDSSNADSSTLDTELSPYELAQLHLNDLADGCYSISSLINSSASVDIPSANDAPGSSLQLYRGNDTDAQVFLVSHDADGFVIISSVKGNVLDAKGGSFANGTRLQLWSSNGTKAQRWIAIKNDDGSFTFVSAGDTDLALDACGGSSSNGTALQLYSSNGTAAQKWQLASAKTSQQRLDEFAAAHVSDIPDGSYAITSALNDGRLLSAASGTLSISSFAYSSVPTFSITSDENGYRTIVVNDGSGRVIDVSGGSSSNGAVVQLYAPNGTKAQKWIIESTSNGYRLVSALSQSKVIDLSGGQCGIGVKPQLYTSNGTAAQRFDFVSPFEVRSQLDALAKENEDVIADGDYVIVAGNADSRMVLDVKGGSTSNSANVQLYQSNKTDAQRWHVSHDDQGYVTLSSKKSGKALDVNAGSADVGSNVQQYDSTGEGNYAQKWIAVKNANGGVMLLSAVWTNRALDVYGGNIASGSNVQIYANNGTIAQNFNFISTAPESVEPCEDTLPADSWVTVSPVSNGSISLDVSGGSLGSGANVQVYSGNGTLSQLFQFEYVNGYYIVRNAGSGLVLDVDNGDIVPGTNVQQWKDASQPSDSQLFAAVAHDDGSYSFINKANGLALAVKGTGQSGSNLAVMPYDGSSSQQFNLSVQENLLPEGLYEIGPSGSSFVLDVAGASAASGANVQTYASNGSFAQKWLVQRVPDRSNTYTFESVCSANLLTVSGDNVVCSARDGSEAQQWTVRIDKGGIALESVKRPGFVVDISGGNLSSSANVQLYKSNDTAAQRFRFKGTSATVSNGTYFIRMAKNQNSVLDVSGGLSSDGANVQIWQNNDSGAQKWNISGRGNGLYAISNAANGKYLDVKDGLAQSGANVQQWSGNGSAAQLWKIEYVSGGFKLTSALSSSLVLDVSGGSTSNGANVSIYTDNDTSAQRFTFKATTYVQPLPSDQQAMLNRAQWYSSNTEWLILTDTVSCRTGIFRGSRGNWKLWSFWQCAPGKNSSPTVLGEFTVYGKGLSFGHGYTCWYYTQFYGDYLFHSQPCYSGTFNVKDYTMGARASAGCIRLTTDHAKWIYDNIPYGTKVVNY